MVNLTVSIPQDLYDKMKKYSEVKWSEVVRKALAQYVGRLEIIERGIVSSEKLSTMLRASKLDVSSIDLEKAIRCYDESRKLEWKRLSTTQASS
jgi:chromosome condensin MukBEF complex kleisin-like MukF subunit